MSSPPAACSDPRNFIDSHLLQVGETPRCRQPGRLPGSESHVFLCVRVSPALDLEDRFLNGQHNPHLQIKKIEGDFSDFHFAEIVQLRTSVPISSLPRVTCGPWARDLTSLSLIPPLNGRISLLGRFSICLLHLSRNILYPHLGIAFRNCDSPSGCSKEDGSF